jgi:GNAT superfamily N-acetyltransferase
MSPSEFYSSTDKKKLDLDMIHDYLSNRSYWARNRSLDKVKKSIEHSLCYGIYNKENKQIGFARVVTDYAVFAWILDLFILEEYQGKGGGKMLMKAIMENPELQDLHRWGLGTRDAHGLYKQFGFEELLRPDVLMEIVNHRDAHEVSLQQ